MQDELNEALAGLKQVHRRMIQKLMLNPEYRAMVTVESSIASISGLMTTGPAIADQSEPADEESDEHFLAIEEAISGNLAPHAVPRLATAPFVPRQHAVLGQAASMSR